MATTMDALLKIRADVQGQNNVVGLQRGLQGVERAGAGAAVALKGLAGSSALLGASFGTLMPLLSVAGLAGLANKSIEAADAMYDLSQRTGVSVEALARFKKAAATSGTDIEGVSKALVRLSKNMYEAATSGKGAAADAFKLLGINIKTASGELKTADEVMLEVADKFAGLRDGAAKTAVATQLFGKAGADMIPMLNMGGKEIDSLSVKMTTAFAEKADAYSDKLVKLSGKVGALGADITILLLPALEKTVDVLDRIVSLAGPAVSHMNRAIPLIGRLARNVVGNPDTQAAILDVQQGRLPSIPEVDKIIGEQRRKALAAQAGLASLGLGVNTDKLLKLLKAQPEFKPKPKPKPKPDPDPDPDPDPKPDPQNGSGKRATGPSQAEINTRALLNTIRFAEGTMGPRGYGTHFGGSYTPPGGLHPDRVMRAGGYASAAYGAYQFMPATWRGAGGGSMTPSRQDEAALRLIRRRGVDPTQPLTRQMIDALAPEWASFPTLKTGTSFYGQGGKTFNQLLGFYRQQVAKGGGDLAAVDLAEGRDAAEAARMAEQAEQERRRQLTAARDLLATKEAQLQVAAAMTPLEKLTAEYDRTRADRMRDYVGKLAEARSGEERDLLVKAQIADWARQELDYKQQLSDLTSQQLTEERERAELLADSIARMEELTSRASAGAGFRQGIQGYVDSVSNLRDAVGDLTSRSIGGLEGALTDLATTGKGNFQEFAASVLRDTTRMIVQQLILKTIMQLIGGISGGGGFEMPASAFIPSGGYRFAKGGVFGDGIVSSPTLFRFANGGAMRTGLMGEAGPEAIMPLRRGPDGRLGVAAAGSGSNSITINVDASGTKASGDPGTGAALARDLAQVVDDRLAYHRLPGGILAT